MELFASLGLYLILAFVLPGLCYLLAFGLCFPEVYLRIRYWLPPDEKEAVQGSSLFAFALVLGLLVSSVTFALEVLLRHFFHDFFEAWYPEINFTIVHDPSSYATVLIPSAIMHFNIGLGILLMFAIYIFYVSSRGEWRSLASPPRKHSVVTSPRVWLAIVMVVIVVANLIAASEVYRRVKELPPASEKNTTEGFLDAPPIARLTASRPGAISAGPAA